ncbi:MAG: protein translocase subunit SecD [Clostridia bacterium]|nr:protein translocase subunit SecD [Clostridia bacterium]
MRVDKLLIFVVLIIALGFAGNYSIGSVLNSINLGLDLQGGLHVLMEAQDSPDNPVTNEDMINLQAIMRNRVDYLGIAEPLIQRQGERRLIIELAGVQSPEEAVKLLGKTAELELRTYDGEKIIGGEDLNDAVARIDTTTQTPYVEFTLKPEGGKRFGEVTDHLVRTYPERSPERHIAIYLDGQLLQNPHVNDAILAGKGTITGGYSDLADAESTAALLRSGALPVSVETLEMRTVGPTLGLDSLAKSQQAGLYGILTIILFMIAYYRVPGTVAVISLTIYGFLVVALLGALNATLTLPGVAGFILSFGIIIDANIIIFERLKEDLRNKKTLRSAVDAAFSKAMSTILDANITTILGAAVLFYFGTGPIRGFAVTLTIGIIVSMFTAIIVTKVLLKLIVESNIFKNPRFFGA